jgi:hypothetical protein
MEDISSGGMRAGRHKTSGQHDLDQFDTFRSLFANLRANLFGTLTDTTHSMSVPGCLFRWVSRSGVNYDGSGKYLLA